MEVDDQAIHIILMGLPKDIYDVVDSCQTTQENWLRVQQMMKGSDIRKQEKKEKLFSEWELFRPTEWESIESYYHCFSKLMTDFTITTHIQEKITRNLKFLNNLQPEWKRYVTIVHQMKDFHTIDYAELYDFLQFKQSENEGNQIGYNVRQIAWNQNGYNVVPECQELANHNVNQNGNGNVVVARAEGNGNGNNGDIDEIEEVNTNYILMANLQQASTLGTQTDKAPVYDSDGLAEEPTSKGFPNSTSFLGMAFEQHISKLELQGITSGRIISGLDLTYAPSTITSQKPTEHELGLLFEAMYYNYIGGQPLAASRTAPAASAPQIL
uniref:Gag-Pol polyprotein n=1 Tax=Tanacetum cinerariifolium TaxID=118510 RepID=A0A699GV38_TANCI|nr:hypothetical protein [Tanacetum cinerariifolium]